MASYGKYVVSSTGIGIWNSLTDSLKKRKSYDKKRKSRKTCFIDVIQFYFHIAAANETGFVGCNKQQRVSAT